MIRFKILRGFQDQEQRENLVFKVKYYPLNTTLTWSVRLWYWLSHDKGNYYTILQPILTSAALYKI